MSPDSSNHRQPNHAHAYWQLPSRSLTGGCLVVIGLGMLMYLWGRLGHPAVWEPLSLLWPVGIAAFAVGLGFVIQKPPPPHQLPPTPGAGEPPIPVVVAEPPPSYGNADLDRVKQVVMSSNLPLELLPDESDIDAKGVLQAYKLIATRPGYFGDKRASTIVITKLETAVDGDWEVDVDPKRDIVSAARKTPFPQFIPPPEPTWIATSAADATAHYRHFKFRLGVNERNEPLEYSPIDFPHMLVIGGTGAGKSVFVRTFLEPFRAAGWPLFISDGKKSDYASLGMVAQVVMISSDTAEHVRLLHAVAEEIHRRADIAQQRKIQHDPDPFAFAPWLVILDEFASVRADVEGLYSAFEDKDSGYLADFLYVARKGREFRVHMVLLTQDLYDKTIPGDARGNFKLIVSLGAPTEMTLKKAFPRELQDKARRLGQRITAHGRGLVADPEAATVVEFQGYFGYTPGKDIEGPDAPEVLRPAWRSYRDNVSNRIPRLYSRQWFAIEKPEDLDEPISVLNSLPMVNLDNPDGTPNPAMLQYDKKHPSYNGLGRSADHRGALLELNPPTAQNPLATTDMAGGEQVPNSDD
ncbi:cell division protein FtsK [Mycobacterium timonense]|uniref:Cell division protein FtsK n=2 Tax=Mycobacterium avium complex (MAC) TaxID=120793 RepID=A0AAW5SE15_MYCBC|nr:cell division protein FtsK [Mycobacterium bouchedurhonense]MCV6994102.1 cell division protein FtsK [Mycobacterium timonense]MDV3307064.1 cell division protein FtsK [Mycobacterium avium subsp. hominissuis]ORA42027.1 hypothetical protein BST19_26635 [Mycobacterium bouchedurhonense]